MWLLIVMTVAVNVSVIKMVYFISLNDLYFIALSLQVPKSPRSIPVLGRKMTHQISHRFTKKFKMMSSCGYCQKQIFLAGLKCKDCKYTCHRECEDKVAPSCGLPQEFLDEFKKKLSMEGGKILIEFFV